MNEKRNHNLPTNQNLSYAIRQAIEYEQRIAFVESICAELNDDPFDPAREYRMVTDLRFGPACEPAVFWDMTDVGPVPSYTVLSDSEMARRYSNEIIRQKLKSINREAAVVHGDPLSPSTAPRGSPENSQRRRDLSVPPAVAGG